MFVGIIFIFLPQNRGIFFRKQKKEKKKERKKKEIKK